MKKSPPLPKAEARSAPSSVSGKKSWPARSSTGRRDQFRILSLAYGPSDARLLHDVSQQAVRTPRSGPGRRRPKRESTRSRVEEASRAVPPESAATTSRGPWRSLQKGSGLHVSFISLLGLDGSRKAFTNQIRKNKIYSCPFMNITASPARRYHPSCCFGPPRKSPLIASIAGRPSKARILTTVLPQ